MSLFESPELRVAENLPFAFGEPAGVPGRGVVLVGDEETAAVGVAAVDEGPPARHQPTPQLNGLARVTSSQRAARPIDRARCEPQPLARRGGRGWPNGVLDPAVRAEQCLGLDVPLRAGAVPCRRESAPQPQARRDMRG